MRNDVRSVMSEMFIAIVATRRWSLARPFKGNNISDSVNDSNCLGGKSAAGAALNSHGRKAVDRS